MLRVPYPDETTADQLNEFINANRQTYEGLSQRHSRAQKIEKTIYDVQGVNILAVLSNGVQDRKSTRQCDRANPVLSPTSTESVPDSSFTIASENRSSAMERLYWSSFSSGFESSFDSHWDYTDSRALQSGTSGLRYRRRSSSNGSGVDDYLKISDRLTPFSASGSVGDVNNMAQQWEEHIAESNKKRIYLTGHHNHPYNFPRWRSNDALTASLIASRENIVIPADSNLPVFRLKMMKETERNANIDKEKLHRQAAATATATGHGKKMSRSVSVDSGVLQLDYKPWYDRKVIHDNVIHESIANSKETWKRFENGLVWKETEKEHQHNRSAIELTKLVAPLQKYSDDAPNITQFAFEIQVSEEGTKDERSQSPDKLKSDMDEKNEEFVENTEDPAGGYRRPNGTLLYGLNNQEQKVLAFFKENIDVIEDLGISIPRPLRTLMENKDPDKGQLFQNLPNEGEKSIADITHEKTNNEQSETHDWDNGSWRRRSLTPGRMYRVESIRSSSGTSWLGSNSESFPYSLGQKTWLHRFHQTVNTPPPENKRPIVEEVDRSTPGRALIAAEIRLQNDREDELRRSRSELGFPDLLETFQIWKYGYSNDRNELPLRPESS